MRIGIHGAWSVITRSAGRCDMPEAAALTVSFLLPTRRILGRSFRTMPRRSCASLAIQRSESAISPRWSESRKERPSESSLTW